MRRYGVDLTPTRLSLQPAGPLDLKVSDDEKTCWPLEASHRSITSPFGTRFHPIKKVEKLHTGIDIGVGYNEPVVSVREGTVVYVSYKGDYGNNVLIQHEETDKSSHYAHLTTVLVSVGDRVGVGEKIGTSGTTGLSTACHLHFGWGKGTSIRTMKESDWLNPLGDLFPREWGEWYELAG